MGAGIQCGRARTPSRAAVANTTGVNNTTVASRLKTAVTTDAITNTATSSRSGRPFAARAIHPPHHANSPSSAHNWANISTAAKNPTTGANSASSLPASASEIAPMPTTIAAAGTATTASGQPNGRITAHASTATNKTTEHTSATTGFRTPALPRDQPTATSPHPIAS